MKNLSILLLLIIANHVYAQQYAVSKVNLKEKQNKMASSIPAILLDAYSKGHIKAYYPKNINVPVAYTQFLNHFGMQEKARLELLNENPFSFCYEKKKISVDIYVINCMQYRLEIFEKVQKNHVTYEMEKKVDFVKIIYSSECTSDGLDVEGPVFKMNDINKLRNSSYEITNPQNPAVTYRVAEFLFLKLYSSY